MTTHDRRVVLWLVVAGTIAPLPSLLWGLPGGKAINNGMRILSGDVPYRDFWTMYAPGHFYVVAGLFKVFGTHVWVQAVGAQLFYAADAAVLFAIARRLGLERRLALAASLAFLLMHWGPGEMSTYETTLLFLLLGVERVIRYAHGSGARDLVIAGILFGIGAWFKHDVAFHVTLGTTVGLAVAWVLLGPRRPPAWVSPAGLAIRIGAGALAGVLPMAAFLAWKAGPDAWHDLIVFPATEFRVVRGEGYPPLLPVWAFIRTWLDDPADPGEIVQVSRHLTRWIQANVPQVVFVAAVFVIARTRRTLAPSVTAVAGVCLAIMVPIWLSAHVQQNTNFFTLWMLSVFLAALVWIRTDVRPRARTALAAVMTILTGSFLVPRVQEVGEFFYFWGSHETLRFPNVAGIRIPSSRYAFHHPIATFIREHVPESEPIYAGLMRHDSIVISNQTFYFVSGRPIASRYNEIHPGFVDREEVQREIIADLERLKVRCAVLWDFGWGKARMDNILATRQRVIPELGATVLDEYFRREFQEVGRYGEYVLVWRKGGAIPPPPR